MGNYRFKFSDMIPNAWFYKLNNLGRNRNQNPMQKPTKKKIQPKPKSSSFSSLSPLSSSSAAAAPPQLGHHLCHQRKSYHFTRELGTAHTPTPDNNLASQFSDPPRKSSKKRRSTKKTRPSNRASLDIPSVSADCSCRASIESVRTKPDSTPEEYLNYPPDSCSSEEDDNDDDSLFPELGSEIEEQSLDKMVSWPNSYHCRVKSDTFIDTNNNPKFEKLSGFDSISQFELPPISTKPDKIEKSEATRFRRSSAKIEERDSDIINNSSKEQRNSSARKLSVNSPGVKLRTNSPRIATKKFLQVHGRKSVSSGTGSGGRRSISESFAIVKSSQDPHRDFKESMVEMIMENNISTSKDLEDLLACYLSLNSDQYHDLIIKVFKQIWLQITDIRLK